MEHKRAIELIERRIFTNEDDIEHFNLRLVNMKREVEGVSKKVHGLEIETLELKNTLKTLKGED